MSPLLLQNYDTEKQIWQTVSVFESATGVGYVVDYMSHGRQRVFVFECGPDDNSTRLYRAEGKMDFSNKKIMDMIKSRDLKLFRDLKDGENYETIVIQSNRVSRQIKFLHSKER